MIKSKDISNALLRTIFILLGIAACGYFLFSISFIIIYLISAILLSFLAKPICLFLQKRFKFNRTLAIVSSLVFFVLVIFGIIMLFVPLILSQSKNLSLLDINSLQKNYSIFIINVEVWFQDHGINYEKYFNVNKITQSFNFNFITDILNSIIGSIGNFGIAFFSIFFICFFILNDQKLVTDNLRAVLPDNNRWRIIASLLRIKNMLAKYAIGLLLQLIVVFILYLIVLLIFGNKNAFVIAFLCAILNIIPYLGPIIGTTLAGLLTMISMIGKDFQSEILPTTIYVIIGFLVVQAIDNNVSQPIISSKSVNSHPLEIFLVILISGITFGIVGMIIAIPVFTMIKVILKEFFPNNKIVSVLTERI